MNVGVLFPSRFKDPGEFLADARAMEAAGVDSVWIEETDDGLDPMLMLAAIAAVADRIRLGFIASATAEPGVERRRALETLQALSRQRLVPESERWRHVNAPLDRDAWADRLREAEGQADGVLVAMNPRLLDILRHPEDTIDRQDLVLAQG
jgi:hypothetical protein